ncbi:autotransporter assembly complex family protein [Marinobacter mobilis]|uniref:autotransporter assembly complex family protein n=1 Tax=Marinobacter mobilis TaxID=488533 RepID=UPI0035C7765E
MPRRTWKPRAVWALLIWLAWSSVLAQQVSVVVQGDYPELQANADAFIGDVEGRSAQRLRRYVPTALTQVREALKALGYYQPELEWALKDDGLPTVVINVIPGEPVHVRSVTVTIEGPANSDPEFLPVLPDRPAVGDVLHHGHYDALQQLIRNRAIRLGYFDSEYRTHTLAVNPQEGYADITLEFVSGQRYRLGNVDFVGAEAFERELLARFVSIEPGELYHADKIAALNADLSNSGYFAQVLVDASPDEAEDLEIPVSVQLTARAPRSVSAGVGFSTDVGPRLKGTWREHWVNPMGHRRGAETELSEPRQNVSAWYEIPLDPPMTDLIRLSAGYQMEDIEDVQSERLTLGQQWQHELDSGWLQILSLRAEGERYRIGGEPSSFSRLLLPGISYSWLTADSPLDPANGFRTQFDIAGSHRKLLSDVDILHVNVLLKGMVTFWDNHRLLTRFQFGGVATNNFDNVPPSLRFFAGGDQSVRGYAYESLSPRDDNGNLAGGRYLIVGSGEYQYSFAERWRLAAFFDRGNAIDHLTGTLVDGVGIGIRWVSPVGPLKFDIAKGMDENAGGDWRIHFSMGPEL